MCSYNGNGGGFGNNNYKQPSMQKCLQGITHQISMEQLEIEKLQLEKDKQMYHSSAIDTDQSTQQSNG